MEIEYLVVDDHFENTLSMKKINLKKGSKAYLHDDNILYDPKGQKLHHLTSHLGHKYFVRNDDHQGWVRHKLHQDIIKLCSEHNKPGDTWGDRLWQTPQMQIYRRPENDDRWLWNQRWYDAKIDELEWILYYLNKPNDN